MRRWLWATVASFVGLTSCVGSSTTIHGITPIYPEPRYEGGVLIFITRRSPTVESLQPTFRWEPAPESDALYDFIIYEPQALNELYYREGLKDPEHKLEITLQPNRTYGWSVRVRRGKNVSDWSRVDVLRTEFPFFFFKTPSK